MVPQTDLVRVQRWVDARNERIPDSARDLIRNDIDVTDRSITIVECRPPWNPDLGPEWTRDPVAGCKTALYEDEQRVVPVLD